MPYSEASYSEASYSEATYRAEGPTSSAGRSPKRAAGTAGAVLQRLLIFESGNLRYSSDNRQMKSFY